MIKLPPRIKKRNFFQILKNAQRINIFPQLLQCDEVFRDLEAIFLT